MATKKIPIVGIVVVVGLIAFMLAVSGGTFKNFSVQNNGLDVQLYASPNSPPVGSSVLFNYQVSGIEQPYVNIEFYVNDVLAYQDGNASPSGYFHYQFDSVGDCTVYLKASDINGFSLSGQSDDITIHVLGYPAQTPTPLPTSTPHNNPAPSPTPHNGLNPTPTNDTGPINGSNNIIQQIINWLQGIIQSIENWLKSIGL